VRRRPGRRVAPEILDQPVDRHGLPRLEQQAGEQGTLLRTAQRDRLTVAPRLELSQDREVQPAAGHSLTPILARTRPNENVASVTFGP
jgi:hypothetical protein